MIVLRFLKTLIDRIVKHDTTSYAAQGAYYLLLGFFPFIILMIIVVTSLGIEYQNELNKVLTKLPVGTSDLINSYLSYSKKVSTSLFSPILISTILISSSAISALRKAFNIADDVKDDRNFFKTKLMAIVFVIIIVIMFTVLLVISAVGLTVIDEISSILNTKIMSEAVFKLLSFGLNFTIFLFVIGLMYYTLPYRKTRLKEILPGMIFAAPSLTLLTQLFGYIVINFTKYSVVYGSLTSIVILLVWMFSSVLILMIGEEINAMFIDGKDKWNKVTSIKDFF